MQALLRRSSDRTNDRSRAVRRTVSGETAAPALRSVSSTSSAAAAAAQPEGLSLQLASRGRAGLPVRYAS